LQSVSPPPAPDKRGEPVPPLLRKLLSDYAASGLPPAYIPLESAANSEEDNDDDE